MRSGTRRWRTLAREAWHYWGWSAFHSSNLGVPTPCVCGSVHSEWVREIWSMCVRERFLLTYVIYLDDITHIYIYVQDTYTYDSKSERIDIIQIYILSTHANLHTHRYEIFHWFARTPISTLPTRTPMDVWPCTHTAVNMQRNTSI